MKLWSKKDNLNKIIESFTVGNDRYYDMYLAKYDIIASKAHAKMLCKIGILDHNEKESIIKELNNINILIENNEFDIEDNFEDIHSKIEFYLTEKLGDLGKKIHTARSRNDQVLVALQLFLKDEIDIVKNDIKELFETLILLSNKYSNDLLPGYTHLQSAMPSSFG